MLQKLQESNLEPENKLCQFKLCVSKTKDLQKLGSLLKSLQASGEKQPFSSPLEAPSQIEFKNSVVRILRVLEADSCVYSGLFR